MAEFSSKALRDYNRLMAEGKNEEAEQVIVSEGEANLRLAHRNWSKEWADDYRLAFRRHARRAQDQGR